MKTYIKQLIDSKGNNLIPVSSTSSCYNSSGFTVDQLLQDLGLDITNLENSLTQLEEDITTQISADIEDLKNRSVKLAESVTWAELQNLKNSNQLNPGQKYIVTDFKTTTTTPETSATGKTMKLILTATSKNSLDENGLALIISSVSGSGGGSSSVSIFEIKYCLDNDTSRFSWANIGEEVETLEIYTDDELWFTNSRTEEIDGTTYYVWENNNLVDEDNDNTPCYLLSTTLELENGDSLDRIHRDLDPETISADYSTISETRTGTKTINFGTGVIYWMRDAKNNSAPYDFKNILFNNHYTFDLNGDDFSESCDNNTIQPAYNSGVQILNKVTFRNTDESDLCSRNFIGSDVRGVNYGPGTCGTDTRLILGEY